MAKAWRIGVGDRVTIEVRCSSDIVDGKFTFDIDGQKVTVHNDLEAIKKVVPYNPKDAFKDVR